MLKPILRAFIDESGQRGSSPKSSDHFVMTAVMIPESDLGRASEFLAQLRRDLKRGVGDTLHWQGYTSHSFRTHAAASLGAQPDWCRVASVIVCKRHLDRQAGMTDDLAYMYTFRFLLERMSWFARDNGLSLDYTLAHVVRFKLETLREYERRLQSATTPIAWEAVCGPGSIDQPARLEYLQLADLAASATAAAFNKDQFGRTEVSYLQHLDPVLYGRSPGKLTTYGLKMHPWTETTRAAYPWIAALNGTSVGLSR